eukprot:scaffold160_cov234-Chaetoceros_neogracile.AAC.2
MELPNVNDPLYPHAQLLIPASTRRLNPIRTLFHNALNNIHQSYRPLLIAQLLSLLLASSGAANASLNFECNLSAPTIQVGLVYFVIMFYLFVFTHCFTEANNNEPPEQIATDMDQRYDQPHHSPRLLFNRLPIHAPLKFYALMAFLDVEANYLTNLSFRYTTLTSVSLLNALAIPSAMLFSRIILKRMYRGMHCVGAIICIIGIVVNVLGDYESNVNKEGDDNESQGSVEDDTYPFKIRGDTLAIMGALLYGLNDTLTERLLKEYDVKEYLGVMGLFGSIICFVQGALIERHSMLDFFEMDEEVCNSQKRWMLLAASAIFGVMSYIGMAYFLVKSEAALLNLSLLTGVLWAALFSVAAENIFPSSHFWISLVSIGTGVFVYEMAPSPMHLS